MYQQGKEMLPHRGDESGVGCLRKHARSKKGSSPTMDLHVLIGERRLIMRELVHFIMLTFSTCFARTAVTLETWLKSVTSSSFT